MRLGLDQGFDLFDLRFCRLSLRPDHVPASAGLLYDNESKVHICREREFQNILCRLFLEVTGMNFSLDQFVIKLNINLLLPIVTQNFFRSGIFVFMSVGSKDRKVAESMFPAVCLVQLICLNCFPVPLKRDSQLVRVQCRIFGLPRLAHSIVDDDVILIFLFVVYKVSYCLAFRTAGLSGLSG